MSKQESYLRSCPFCDAEMDGDGGVQLSLVSTANGCFAVNCYCGAAGPIRDNEDKAIEA